MTEQDERRRLLDRAESLIALEQWDVAEQLYRQLQTEDPCTAGLGLGEIALQSGHPEQALACFDAVLALAPEDEPALLGRARALLAASNPVEAQQAFRTVLARNEGRAEAHHGLGLALAASGQNREAEDEQCRAVELDPRFYPAWIERGRLATERGSYEGGLYAFNRALEIDGDRAEGVLYTARLLRAMGDNQEAAGVLERAAEGVLADHPQILNELAEIYVATDQLDSLGGLAMRLQTVLPRDPCSLHRVAFFLHRSGLGRLALDRIEEGLALNPSPAEQQALLELRDEIVAAARRQRDEEDDED